MKLRSNCLSSHRLRFFGPVLAAFSAAGVARGQEGAARLPELPSGFYEAAATVIGEEEAPSFGKLDFELGLLSRYDSNVTLGAPQGRIGEESDFLIQPSLKSSFQLGSGSGEWRFGLKGSVTRMDFNELDRFNVTNYSFGLNGGYQSTRAKLLFNAGYASTGGINRFVGDLFEQTSVSSRLTGDYTISPKSSLELSVNQSSQESVTSGFADTSSTTFRAAALWQATPLIRLGPGFRYGVRTAEIGASVQEQELTVTGPVLRLDYKLSTKVSLTSNVGLDFADSPSGDDELLNWRVGLNYRASSLWGLNLRMIRDTQATLFAGGGFDQVSSYRFGYTRKIRSARLNLGVSYEDREPQGSNQVVSGFRDSGYLNYTASLGLPVFGDEVDLSLDLAWRDFDTADSLQSWNGFQSGLSWKWLF
ncbi:hypothetical protein OAG38_02865 [Akkermansiaceae bacterium]|nr:hypothetical protein [Akkermansiaceae bacterium]